MTEQARVTASVVDFIDSASLAGFPTEAVAIAKRCIIDGLGVMLAGSTQEAGHILSAYMRETDGRAEATAFGPAAFRTSAASAALLNGTNGHALDWDDTQLATTADRIFGLLTHPTVPPLAAALAVGERQRASGAEFLEAFLTGFEVECRIADAIHPSHYKKGFHSSGTAGTFGAAVAAAKLMRLDAGKTAHALAIAASMAARIRVSFGTMTKPLHVGRAAQSGVVAAELAARGFTGGKDALDPPWGFLQVFSHGDGFDADRIFGKLGNPHTIVRPGVSIKPYPCGVLGHPMMDAMRRLVIEHDVKPERIAAIRVRAGSNILNPLRYAIANTELEAKFCPAFMVSAIALRRKAGIQEFNDAFVQSVPVQEMMRKVERVLDADIEAKGWEKIRSTVEVDLIDGRTLVEHADERYRGGPDLPFTRDELYEKFSDCASLVLSDTGVGETFGIVESLEKVADIAELVRVLAGSAPPDDRREPMNLAWLSVGALVLAVLLSCTTSINVGLLSMALALVIGVFVGGLTPSAVLAGFPTDLTVTLIGVTLLFSIAECNGTLASVTRRLTHMCHGHRGVLPVMFFIVGFVLATIGAGATPASALLAPPAMAVAARAGIPLLLMAIMAGNGALAGTLSPFAPTGIVAHGVMQRINLGGVEWQTFAYNALAHTLVGVGGFVLLGGWRLFLRRDRAAPVASEPLLAFDTHQRLTAVGIFVLIVTVAGLGMNVGMMGLIIATALILLRAANEAQSIQRMPWSVILMVTGVTVLISLMQETEGLALIANGIARVSTPRTVEPIVAFGVGLVSVYSSTSGVVLPAFLPMAPELAQRLGGIDPLNIAWSMNVSASLVDLSSLSTVGALFIAGAPPGTDVKALFNGLLAWGLTMSVVGALLCWILFG